MGWHRCLNSVAGTDLDYHKWVALKLTSESQSPIPVESAAGVMAGGLKIAEAAARRILDDLSEAADHRSALAPRDHGLSVTRIGVRVSDRSWSLLSG